MNFLAEMEREALAYAERRIEIIVHPQLKSDRARLSLELQRAFMTGAIAYVELDRQARALREGQQCSA